MTGPTAAAIFFGPDRRGIGPFTIAVAITCGTCSGSGIPCGFQGNSGEKKIFGAVCMDDGAWAADNIGSMTDLTLLEGLLVAHSAIIPFVKMSEVLICA
jgi:hypothetical protein